jgi:small basic protein
MLQFTFSWVGILTLVVTVILPVLTGLVTTKLTSPGKKAIVLALLAAITGFGSELLNALTTNTAYDVFAGLLTFITAFVIAVALHFGFWKPVGTTDAAQSTPGFIK